jgi:hypothetical protein
VAANPAEPLPWARSSPRADLAPRAPPRARPGRPRQRRTDPPGWRQCHHPKWFALRIRFHATPFLDPSPLTPGWIGPGINGPARNSKSDNALMRINNRWRLAPVRSDHGRGANRRRLTRVIELAFGQRVSRERIVRLVRKVMARARPGPLVGRSELPLSEILAYPTKSCPGITDEPDYKR